MLEMLRSKRNLMAWLGVVTLSLAIPSAALAVVDVSLVWTATTGAGTTGGSAIDAEAGDVLTAELRVAPGPEGLSAIGVSLQFDADGSNELDLVSATELCTVVSCGGLTPLTTSALVTTESGAGVVGLVETYEAATLSDGPAGVPVTLGSVVLQVTSNVANDGQDLAFVLRPGVDGLLDNASATAGASFGFAAVNAPEPTAASMLAIAAPFLVGLGRRRRRSPKR